MNNYLIDKGVEIFTKKNITTTINIFNDTLRNIDVSNITKHLLKAKVNNKYVTLSAENLDNEKELYNELTNISNTLDNEDESSFASEEIISDREHTLKDNKDIIKELTPLYNTYKQKYKDLHTLNVYYTENYNEYMVHNKNLNSTDKTINYNIYIELIFKNNNVPYDSFINIIDIDFDIDQVTDKLNETCDKLLDKYNKKELETSTYTTLLTSNVVNKIMNQFTGMFFSKNINDNLSILTDKYNKDVFNKLITIVEDPTNNKYPGKRLFDTEGTKTFYKEIIKDGKFINKLYDNQSSKLDNTKSTGNSYGTRNLMIKPSNKKISIENGLIITNVEGTHAGINSISGEISLQASGYLTIDNKKEYINSFILSTNIIKLLNSVTEVGNDLEFYSESIAMPSLIVENISIIGSK